MPRLIFKCPHLPAGGKTAKGGGYVRYIATRDGAASYELEVRREGYLNYIAQRPRAKRVSNHALFDSSGQPLILSKVAEEVARHPGTVWLPILSLTRADAARLGYDNPRQWQALLSAHAMELAGAMKIPHEQFRWCAAFHDEKDHPHVHMVCYSADGKSGYLNQAGIARFKAALAKDIFRQELTELYREQTVQRDALGQEAEAALSRLAEHTQEGAEDDRLEELLMRVAGELKTTSGKKQYGYLKPPLKKLVDEIVDRLAQDRRIAAAYELWYRQREEVLRTYKEDLPERVPLSQQKEFRQIRNLVIREAARLAEDMDENPPLDKEQAVQACSFHECRGLGNGACGVPAEAQCNGFGGEEEQAPLIFGPSLQSKAVRPKGACDDSGVWGGAPSVPPSAARLLRQVEQLFQSQPAAPERGFVFVDSKLKQKIREKKIAQGHKADDHIDQEIQ